MGSPGRGAAPRAPARALLERSIGPVWEANHVWLIFVLVYLWTAFPEPFVAIASTMLIPLSLAAFGIILRGSAFAFRKWAGSVSRQRLFGAAFAGSSALTPFFLGTVAGGVASGRVPLGNAAGDPLTSWLNPTSMLGGTLAVVTCAYLAAVLVSRDAAAGGSEDLAEYFRRRALISGALAGLVALAGVFVLRLDAPDLFNGLLSVRASRSWRRRDWGDRLDVAAVQAALGRSPWDCGDGHSGGPVGMGAGQYPWLLEQEALVDAYAASDPVLQRLAIAFGAGRPAGNSCADLAIHAHRTRAPGRRGHRGSGIDRHAD